MNTNLNKLALGLAIASLTIGTAQAKPGNGKGNAGGKSWGQAAVPDKGAPPAWSKGNKGQTPVRTGWDKKAKHYAYGKGCFKTCKWHKHNNGKALGKDPIGKIIHKILH